DVGAATRQVVDRGDGLGQDRGVPVARAVDQRATAHAGRVARQRRVEGDGLEVRVALEVGGVEVVPDRDPVEPEVLDAGPERAQLVDGRVLRAGGDAEA